MASSFVLLAVCRTCLNSAQGLDEHVSTRASICYHMCKNTQGLYLSTT